MRETPGADGWETLQLVKCRQLGLGELSPSSPCYGHGRCLSFWEMGAGLGELSLEESEHPSPLLPPELHVLTDRPWNHACPCPPSHPAPRRGIQPSRHVPRGRGEEPGQKQPGERAGSESRPRGSRRREGSRRGKPEGRTPSPQEPAPPARSQKPRSQPRWPGPPPLLFP